MPLNDSLINFKLLRKKDITDKLTNIEADYTGDPDLINDDNDLLSSQINSLLNVAPLETDYPGINDKDFEDNIAAQLKNLQIIIVKNIEKAKSQFDDESIILKQEDLKEFAGSKQTDFLLANLYFLLETYAKVSVNPQYAPINSDIMLNALVNEIWIAANAYRIRMVYHNIINIDNKESRKKILRNFIIKFLQSLQDGINSGDFKESDEVCFPCGFSGHAMYLIFKLYDVLLLRIDNLNSSSIAKHKPSGELARPYMVTEYKKNVPLNNNEALIEYLIKICLTKETSADKAIEVIYNTGVGVSKCDLPKISEKTRNIAYPPLKKQINDNCVLINYQIGMKYRLACVGDTADENFVYNWLMREDLKTLSDHSMDKLEQARADYYLAEITKKRLAARQLPQKSAKQNDYLPDNVAYFWKRQELKTIIDKLNNQTTPIKKLAIIGYPGSGKTELAKYFARYHRKSNHNFANAFCYILDFKTIETSYQKMLDILDIKYDKDNPNFINIKKQVEEKLRDKSWIIICDDVKDYSDIENYMLTPYPSSNGIILITTQTEDFFENSGFNIDINGGLHRDDARKFIKSFCSKHYRQDLKIAYSGDLEQDAKELARKLEYMPLSIMSCLLHFKSKNQKNQQRKAKFLSLKDYQNLIENKGHDLDTTYNKLINEQGLYKKGQVEALVTIINDLPNQVLQALFFCSMIHKQAIPKSLLMKYINKIYHKYGKQKKIKYKEIAKQCCSLINFELQLPDINDKLLSTHAVTQYVAMNVIIDKYKSSEKNKQNLQTLCENICKVFYNQLNATYCTNFDYLIPHCAKIINNLQNLNLDKQEFARNFINKFIKYLVDSGHINMAYKYLKDILADLNNKEKLFSDAVNLSLLSRIHIIRGEFNLANNILTQVENILLRYNNNQNALLHVYLQRAHITRKLGDLVENDKYLQKACNLISTTDERIKYQTKYLNERIKSMIYDIDKINNVEQEVKKLPSLQDFEEKLQTGKLCFDNIDSLILIADVYVSLKRPNEGMPYIKLAAQAIEKLKANQSSYNALALKIYSLLLAECKDYENATTMYQQSYKEARVLIGNKDRALLEIYINLIYCRLFTYAKSNQYDKTQISIDLKEMINLINELYDLYRGKLAIFKDKLTALNVQWLANYDVTILAELPNIIYNAYVDMVGQNHPYSRLMKQRIVDFSQIVNNQGKLESIPESVEENLREKSIKNAQDSYEKKSKYMQEKSADSDSSKVANSNSTVASLEVIKYWIKKPSKQSFAQAITSYNNNSPTFQHKAKASVENVIIPTDNCEIISPNKKTQ